MLCKGTAGPGLHYVSEYQNTNFELFFVDFRSVLNLHQLSLKLGLHGNIVSYPDFPALNALKMDFYSQMGSFDLPVSLCSLTITVPIHILQFLVFLGTNILSMCLLCCPVQEEFPNCLVFILCFNLCYPKTSTNLFIRFLVILGMIWSQLLITPHVRNPNMQQSRLAH